MTVDMEQLREDLKSECLEAFFGGGFGAALIECEDIEKASPEELIQIAQRFSMNFLNYEIS